MQIWNFEKIHRNEMRLLIIAQLSESNKTTARLKMCNISLTAYIIS